MVRLTDIYSATPANEAYFGKGAYIVRSLPPDHEHTAHAAEQVRRAVEWSTTGLPLALAERWHALAGRAADLTARVAEATNPDDLDVRVFEEIFATVRDLRRWRKEWPDTPGIAQIIDALERTVG